jgi:chromosome segregation ATPase
MMKDKTNILIVLLLLSAGITFFSGYKYFSSLKEKYDLLTQLQQINEEVESLEADKNTLELDFQKEKRIKESVINENAQLKDELKLSQDQIGELENQLRDSTIKLDKLDSRVAVAKAENSALREQIESLQLQLSQVSQDRQELQARLSSIEELKKAIKELRQKISLTRSDLNQGLRTESGDIIIGNRGFIIKDGKPTFPAKVRIEVAPLPTAN